MPSPNWSYVTCLLCLYGFLKELRPSEPFLTEYLITPNWTNLTLEQAYNDVYPVWTYSYLGVLVAVFLLTDWLRYKPVIVLEGFAYIATWMLLLYARGVAAMQLMQICYGVATSTEVAYYTYIYAQTPRAHFRAVTSHTRVALLLGRFLSGVLAQLLTSLDWLDYKQLNYLTLISVAAATATAFFLPKVESGIYFGREEVSASGQQLLGETANTPRSEEAEEKAAASSTGSLGSAFLAVRRDFCSSFSDRYVLKWSVWWALGMCGNFQVGNYIQPLWETVAPVGEAGAGHIYNGAVEAATTLMGALLAFLLGYVHLNWSLVGEPTLFLISLVDAILLMTMAFASEIWVAYGGYFAFRSFYQMMITVASYEIARNIGADSYGLVFGFNTFLALFFQTILTLVVTDKVGLQLEPRMQFFVYGLFFLMIGLLFLSLFVLSLFRPRNGLSFLERCKAEGIWVAAEDECGNPEGGLAGPEGGSETPGAPGERREVPMGTIEQQ